MQVFREFELQAIHILSAGVLSDSQKMTLREVGLQSEYEYTGCGYFLTVTHLSLPIENKTLSKPPVVGTSGEIQAGFLVFLGNHELTLECHSWGGIDVPNDFRDREIVISTPPINLMGPKNFD